MLVQTSQQTAKNVGPTSQGLSTGCRVTVHMILPREGNSHAREGASGSTYVQSCLGTRATRQHAVTRRPDPSAVGLRGLGVGLSERYYNADPPR